jgi:hypothetical protein
MVARLLLALTIALAALPARAQGLIGMSPEAADALIGAALDAPYGQAHLKTFAASVRKDGDAACLQARALDDAALIARGRALLQRYGVKMVRLMNEKFDRTAYQTALAAAGEPDAAAEIARLEDDPAVKKYIELYRPARLVKVLDSLTEQFDRYVLIGRFKLATVSAVGRGDPTDDPTDAIEAAVQKHLEEHPSDQVERYLELLDAVEAATPKGLKRAGQDLSPMAFFAGADRDLAELCIGRR